MSTRTSTLDELKSHVYKGGKEQFMVWKKSPGRPRSEAARLLLELHNQNTDECQFFLRDQQRVSWGGTSRTPQWISCTLANGQQPKGTVPVRTCGTYACVNGSHQRWGTHEEASADRKFPDRKASRNPNAKLDWGKVRAIRAIKWQGGDHRFVVMKKYGITMSTLKAVLKNRIWVETMADKGDEF